MGALVDFYETAPFTGSAVKEYLLLVRPQDDVRQRIRQEQARLDQYLDEHSRSENVIIVAAFFAKEEMEATILRWMHRIFSEVSAFEIVLNNYGSSPASGAIHLRVQDHQPFKKIANELRVIDELVQSNGLPKARIMGQPHLMIASGLDEKVCQAALMEIAGSEFHDQFAVQEFSLVKRLGPYDSCVPVSVFRLQP